MQNGSSIITGLTNLQIVNGGQTTATLFTYANNTKNKEKSNLDQIQVPFKLIVIREDLNGGETQATGTETALPAPVPQVENLESITIGPDSSEDLVHNISRYSNSQNKISEVDLSSNTRLHRMLEVLSRRITAPNGTRFYYERTKGSYLNELNRQPTLRARNDFTATYPRNLRIDKNAYARIENLWLRRPHIPCKGAQQSFTTLMTDLKKTPPLVDETYYKRLCAKHILVNEVQRQTLQAGYGGLITSFANYFTAFLFDRTNHRIDLDKIWQNQNIDETLQASIHQLIADNYDILDEIINAAKANPLSSWAKEATWKKFQDQAIFEITPELEGILLKAPLEDIPDPDQIKRAEWETIQDFFRGKADTIENFLTAFPKKKWITSPYDDKERLTNYTQMSYIELRRMENLSTRQQDLLHKHLLSYKAHLEEQNP